MNCEEEVNLSRDDLLRFAEYNIMYSRAHNREFITVIFVKEPARVTELHTRQLSFKPIVVQCSEIDADAKLAALAKAIAEGGPVNELELIYLPMFNSSERSATQLFKESAGLISKMRVEDSFRRKMFTLLLAQCGKVVDKAELKALYEEVTKIMGNVILEYAEEYGERRGIKIGEERGEERGIRLGEERGERRGIRLGEEQKAEESARKMLAKGFDVSDIMEILNITIERLREIQTDMGL
jgi:hypothetical protein